MTKFAGSAGGKATELLEKTYSYSTTSGNIRTTYTKKVPIHLCGACSEELDERQKWKYYMSASWFVFIAAVTMIFTDFWIGIDFMGFAILFGFIGVLSFLLGSFTGNILRKLIDKENIREFKRDIKDHPLVKLVKSEGYS